MTSDQPTEQSRPPVGAGNELSWNSPATWAMFGTIFVLVPVTSIAMREAAHAGVPYGVLAVATGAMAVAAFAALLLKKNTSKVGAGVLFGLWLLFIINAVDVTALALDVSELWVMAILAVPILAVLAWRYLRHGESPF